MCLLCKKCFFSSQHLKVHEETHTNEPLPCNICGKTFKTSNTLWSHTKTHSIREKKYKCPNCTKLFLTKTEVKFHIMVHTGEKPHKCPNCENKFKSKSELNCHFKIHFDEKPHICTKCQMPFKTLARRNKHFKVVHILNEFVSCQECGLKLKESSLKNHFARHSSEKTIPCALCDKLFINSTMKNRHEIIHQDNKMFQC